jgi:glutamate-1-semialdehyde 2,1-aminomutase
MYAARANLKELLADRGKVFQHTWSISEALCDGLRALFADTGTSAIVQNVGPMLQILFTEREAITDYREFCDHVDRDTYRRLALALFRHGVYMTPSAALHSVACTAHSPADVEQTLAAFREALGEIGKLT